MLFVQFCCVGEIDKRFQVDIALLHKSSQSYEASFDIWITQYYLPPDTSEHAPP